MAEEATEVIEPAKAAPEASGTAPVVEAPVSGEEKPVEQSQDKPVEKSYSKAEVEAIVEKRLARERRALERQQPRQVVQEAPKPEQPARPKPEDFRTTEEYIHAAAQHEAKQIVELTLSEREKQQRDERVKAAQAKAQSEYSRREEVARVQHEDYDDVVYNPILTITEPMMHSLMSSDRGADIAYHLGKNPTEAARIAQLPPFLQAKEIGKLEAKLPEHTEKTTTSAPPPIKPLGGGKTAVVVTDINDPRAAKSLTTDQWMKERERQYTAQWEAQGKR